jgi:hypothetical protein
VNDSDIQFEGGLFVRALVGVDERSVSKDDDWRAENEIQWTKLVKLRWGTAGPCLDDSI